MSWQQMSHSTHFALFVLNGNQSILLLLFLLDTMGLVRNRRKGDLNVTWRKHICCWNLKKGMFARHAKL